jgi:hypothetical protein
MEGSKQVEDSDATKGTEQRHSYASKDGDQITNAGKQLAEFVDPLNLLDRPETEPRRPLVILSFDEAQILTDNPSVMNRTTKWNMFSELRRILRQTSDYAIFSLFLSTAGRFNLFSPEISTDPSFRVKNFHLSTLDPITEISFDELAYPAPEYGIELKHVVEFDWMCHLGRPLYALFECHFSAQLTPHLEQVRVYLRRHGQQVQKLKRSLGLCEAEVAER